jgi:hypothetical protein
MRILVWLLGGIAAVVMVVAVMGMRLPKEHRVQNSAEISAPPLAVWTAISDVSSGPQWRSDLKRVEVLDQRHWREYSKTGSTVFRLDHSEPITLRVVVIDDRNLPYQGRCVYKLAPLPNGNTLLTITEDGKVYHPIWRFVAHYIIGERTSIDRYLNDLHKSFQYPSSRKATAG